MDTACRMPRVTNKVETHRWLREPARTKESGDTMLFGGIDVAKHNHEICVTNDSGDSVLQMSFANSAHGFQKLIQAVGRLIKDTSEVVFCMEATGHYWLALYCHLTDMGYQVKVINPIQSDALRNLYIRKSKTDRKDSFILADLVRLGRTPETKLSSEVTLKLQTLSRMRFEFVTQVGGLKQRVLGVLDRIFPEYASCFSDVFIRTSRELLKLYSDPSELAEVDLSELSSFLTEHSRGRLGMERAEKIRALAGGTFGINLAMDAFTLELRLMLEQIEFISDQIKVIEEAIGQVMDELNCKDAQTGLPSRCQHVLETVPGIGTVLAAAIIGEVGDINRFPNARTLVAYAGLDATVKASGQFEGTRNRMSKRGSPVLRNSLWLAAISARRYMPEMKAYYETKKAQGKHVNVATGAVARKLVHIIYTLWKEQRPYDPNYRWSAPESSSINDF